MAKAGVLGFNTDQADYAAVMQSIDQQAADMASQGQQILDQQYGNQADAPETEAESQQQEDYGRWRVDRLRTEKEWGQRRYRTRRTADRQLRDMPTDGKVKTQIDNSYQYPFDKVSKFLPETGGPVATYTKSAMNESKHVTDKINKSAAYSQDYLRGAIEPGMAPSGILTVPMREMGSAPDPEKLKKRYGLGISQGMSNS